MFRRPLQQAQVPDKVVTVKAKFNVDESYEPPQGVIEVGHK